MTTSALNRVIDTARIHCPGAGEGMMRLEIFNVLKEFFSRTSMWTFEMIVTVIRHSNDYMIETGQNVAVVRLMSINRPRTEPPLPPRYLPTDPPQYLELWTVEGQWGTNEAINPLYSVPRDAVLLNAGTKCPIMRIRWNPQADELWVVTFALNVTDPTDSEGLPNVPDWIIDKYNNQISDGVISRLMLQPGKPYSSQQGAAFHGRRFFQGMGQARQDARNMFTYGSQRWSFPQTWNYRRPRIP
jgi:hypothetical protein